MYKATQTRIQTYLNDVAGVRIVCAFIDDNRLDEQIRQAVLSLETKWTEKEIGFQVELEEVKYTANEGAVSLRVSQNVFGVVLALAFCVIFYWFMPKKRKVR